LFSRKNTWFIGSVHIWRGTSHQGRLFLQREYGVFMIYLFSPLRALCQQSGNGKYHSSQL
ncbi:hypothetical protein, partial [Yersinia enterocolitica]|uniref:hypothetical protein n=1 Tax=Yersinia enterocolitica TaxID=630 RepID=UPI00338E68C0